MRGNVLQPNSAEPAVPKRHNLRHPGRRGRRERLGQNADAA